MGKRRDPSDAGAAGRSDSEPADGGSVDGGSVEAEFRSMQDMEPARPWAGVGPWRTARFVACAAPRPQPRPRAFIRNGRICVYGPHNAAQFRREVGAAAVKAVAGTGFAGQIQGPVRLAVEFHLKRPKRLGKQNPQEVLHLAKPDIDNLLKAVMDGLTESGVIVDDSQIYEQHAVKVYHGLGSMPKAVIELAWAEIAE